MPKRAAIKGKQESETWKQFAMRMERALRSALREKENTDATVLELKSKLEIAASSVDESFFYRVQMTNKANPGNSKHMDCNYAELCRNFPFVALIARTSAEAIAKDFRSLKYELGAIIVSISRI